MNESGRIGAYHGSQHRFEAFSMEKIGTGEGAQSYGHGLYFAENPEVARTYRPNEVAYRVVRGEYEIGNAKAGQALQQQNGDVEKALTSLRRQLVIQRRNPTPLGNQSSVIENQQQAYQRGVTESAIAQLEGGHIVPEKGSGGLYHVSINAEPHDFLQWDKPLSEQPEVMRRLAQSDIPGFGKQSDGWRNAPAGLWEKAMQTRTGEQLYREMGPDQVAASNRLNQMGIKGIRYLDQGSRAAGAGSYNYVVFDDKIIEILNSGVSGTAMLAALTGLGLSAAVAQKLIEAHHRSAQP